MSLNYVIYNLLVSPTCFSQKGGHTVKATNTWIPLNRQCDREFYPSKLTASLLYWLLTHSHFSLQESLDPLRLTADQKPPWSGWQSDSFTEVSSGGFPHKGEKHCTFLKTRKALLQHTMSNIDIYLLMQQ